VSPAQPTLRLGWPWVRLAAAASLAAIADNRAMKSRGLALVPLTADHFPTLAGWFSSEREVVQWGGRDVRFPLEKQQLQAMADESLTEPPARLCWMARRERELVGHAQLALDCRHGNALIGRVAVAPQHRGQGLAVAMLELVLAEAFSIETIERVELNVFTWNAPAIATYKRLGFQTEGIRRSCTRVGEERWDSAMMGLLRTERQPSA
jgi:RimJ/RimL family protein N-acetyltransferase